MLDRPKTPDAWPASPSPIEGAETDRTPPSLKSRDSVVFLVRSDVKKELERGKLRFEEGDTDAARLAYEQALDLDPSCPIAYFYLGFTHHELGDLELAKEYYLQAIDLDRRQTLFLEHLARLHFESGEYSVCLVRFQEARSMGPLQPISYGLMGRAFYELDRYTEAVDCLEKMLNAEEEPRLLAIARYYAILSHLKEGSLIPARKQALALLEEVECDSVILSGLADRFEAVGCLSLTRQFLLALVGEMPVVEERLLEIESLIEIAEAPLSKVYCSEEEKLLHHLHQASKSGTERTYRTLLSLWSQGSPLVRESILNYCRKFGFSLPRALIGESLAEGSLLEQAALRYTAETYQPEWTDLMLASLNHPSKEVQLAAARFLERRGSLSHVSFLDHQMEIAEGASLRRQLQRAINQIKRRHTEQNDTMAAAPVTSPRPRKGVDGDSFLRGLCWFAVGFAAVYLAIRLLLLLA